MADIFNEDLHEICNWATYAEDELPARYLGISLAYQKLNVVYYDPLIEQIVAHLNVLIAHSLSYMKMIKLIKSIAQDIECYWLQNFHPPMSVHQQIIQLCWVFLWGSSCLLV